MLFGPEPDRAEELYKRTLHLQNRPQRIHTASTEDLRGLKQDTTLDIRRKKGLASTR
jgi:hypothetical protein